MDRRPRAEAGLQRTPLRRGGVAVRPATRVMSLGRDSAWKQALVAALPDLPSPFAWTSRAAPATWPFFSRTLPRRVVTGWISPHDAGDRAGTQPVRERPVRAGRPVRSPVSRRFHRCRDRELRPSQRARPSESRRRGPPGAIPRRRCGVPRLFESGAFPPPATAVPSSARLVRPLGTPPPRYAGDHGYVAESLREFPDRTRLRESSGRTGSRW